MSHDSEAAKGIVAAPTAALGGGVVGVNVMRNIQRVAARVAGSALRRNFFNRDALSERTEAIVVSEMKERLSPNIAPPTMVPIERGREHWASLARGTAIGTIEAITPIEEPIAMLIDEEIRKSPGNSAWWGK